MKILFIIIAISIVISLYKINKKDNSVLNDKGNNFRNNFIIISIVLIICVFLYLKTIWVQMLDVGPERNGNFTKKVLWVNMNKLDVTNDYHKNWSKKLLIDSAPNKLGCYVDTIPDNFSKLDMLEHSEKFNMMFKHPLEKAYFIHKPSEEVKKFCDDKQIKIIRNTFRRTIK